MTYRTLRRLAQALVSALSFLVPSGERLEWLREWHAEIEHHGPRRDAAMLPGDGRLSWDLFRRTLGALPHAIWLRAQEWRLEMLLQDLKYALRTHLRAPGFTAVAILTLGIGIGASTVVFTMVNTVLLRPYPWPQSERIYFLANADSANPGIRLRLSYPDFVDIQENSSTLEATAVYDWEPFNLRRGDRTVWIEGGQVSADLFRVLGVTPTLGRGFLPEDDRPGADPVVVLRESLWRWVFGADPGVLGEQVIVDGEAHTVIGVMPNIAEFPPGARLWVPLGLDPSNTQRGSHWAQALARVKADVPVEAARAELAGLGRGLEQRYPDTNRGRRVALFDVRDVLSGDTGPVFLMLLGAVGLLLLIVCANVANLLLARASSRERELGMRTALGASRTRLIRQLMTESCLLAVGGAALGTALAYWGMSVSLRLIPIDLPGWLDFGFDYRVLAFTGSVSVLAALVFGLAPAFQAAPANLTRTLQEGPRSGTSRPSRTRMKAALVVSELALSVMLLVGAGLMVRSFLKLSNVSPGFETENRVVGTVQLSTDRYDDDDERRRFARELRQRLEVVPGVAEAGLVNRFPLSGSYSSVMLRTASQDSTAYRQNPMSLLNSVSPGYFEAMGIPLLRGRPIRASDDADAMPVVVVNQRFAEHFWPDQNPIGKRLTFGIGVNYREVVGVVGTVKHIGLDRGDPLEMYVPYQQAPGGRISLVVQSRAGIAGVSPSLVRAVSDVDANLALSDLSSLESIMAESIWQWRFFTQLFWLFGAIAVVLAAVGVYGVISYTVSRRTQEMGVRMALGAQRGDVVGLIVRQAGLVIGIGVMVGVAAAFGLSRVMQSILYEIDPLDPVTFAGVTVTLTGVALIAAYLPARRASRIDPARALREE